MYILQNGVQSGRCFVLQYKVMDITIATNAGRTLGRHPACHVKQGQLLMDSGIPLTKS
jgi:hypothetical protein